MPPLILFGRQWRIATDDFVYPSVVEVILRWLWIAIISIILGFHVRETSQVNCMGKEYHSTTVYLAITLVILILICINLHLLAAHSSRGKMWELVRPGQKHPRRHVSTFLYINVFLTASELAWTIVGTYFVLKDLIRCMNDVGTDRVVIIIVLVVVILTYLIIGVKIIIALLLFRPFSMREEQDDVTHVVDWMENRRKLQTQETELNYRSLRCLMPCTNDEDTIQAFRDIAGLLSKIFHDSDLVPSDILAGLLLIHYKHRIHGQSYLYQVPYEDGSQSARSSCLSQPEQTDFLDLKYFYKYAAAAYGYLWFILDDPVTNPCLLGRYLTCCACTGSRSGDLEEFVRGDDGCCECNKAAVLAMLKKFNNKSSSLPDAEPISQSPTPSSPSQDDENNLLVLDIRNTVQAVPYLMVVDKGRRAIVVGIRGTMSIHDMLTDLRGDAGSIREALPEDQRDKLPEEWKCHHGMLEAAKYVYNRLHGLQTRPGVEEHSSDQVDRLGNALARYPDYQVVVTGHSLGAGTAAILGFLLRSKYTDREVRCFAYSPPGGLLSPEASEESKKFTLSLVVGDDVIPRTSISNIARLAKSIKAACKHCELPKYKVLGYGLLNFCCCLNTTVIQDEVAIMYPTYGPHLQNQERDSLPPTRPYTEDEVQEIQARVSSANTDKESDGKTEDLMMQTPVHSNTGSEGSRQVLLSPQHSDIEAELQMTERMEVRERLEAQHGPIVDQPLFLPGRIYYMEDPEMAQTRTQYSADTPQVPSNCSAVVRVEDNSSFLEIIVSPRMLTDHLPNYVGYILNKI